MTREDLLKVLDEGGVDGILCKMSIRIDDALLERAGKP
jgi:hypothetical protein